MRRRASKRAGIRIRKSGYIPRTLIDASTAALAKEGLTTMAAAMASISSCHAGILRQYARQVGDSYTSAQAVANYTEVASAAPTFTEPTFTDGTWAEGTHSEKLVSEPPA